MTSVAEIFDGGATFPPVAYVGETSKRSSADYFDALLASQLGLPGSDLSRVWNFVRRGFPSLDVFDEPNSPLCSSKNTALSDEVSSVTEYALEHILTSLRVRQLRTQASLSPLVSAQLDDVRGTVRIFEALNDGWDGEDSRAPIEGVVDDALEVLQHWRGEVAVPEANLSFDGVLSLELYQENGMTLGGVEFIGQHQAIFTVVSETKILHTGRFNAEKPSEIMGGIELIHEALKAI